MMRLSWYRKKFEVPEDFKGMDVQLNLKATLTADDLMLEVNAGDGKFITTTFDPARKDPAARYFFDQVVRYITSDDFEPEAMVELEFFKNQLTHDAGIREHIVEFKKDGVIPNLKRDRMKNNPLTCS